MKNIIELSVKERIDLEENIGNLMFIKKNCKDEFIKSVIEKVEKYMMLLSDKAKMQ